MSAFVCLNTCHGLVLSCFIYKFCYAVCYNEENMDFLPSCNIIFWNLSSSVSSVSARTKVVNFSFLISSNCSFAFSDTLSGLLLLATMLRNLDIEVLFRRRRTKTKLGKNVVCPIYNLVSVLQNFEVFIEKYTPKQKKISSLLFFSVKVE